MTFFGFLPVALETMKMLQDNLLKKSLGVDTVCVTGGSVRFPVHSFVLASGSETLAKQIKFAETLGPTVLDFQVGLSFSGFLSGFFLSLYLSHLHTSRKLYAVFLLQDHRRSSLLRLANPSWLSGRILRVLLEWKVMKFGALKASDLNGQGPIKALPNLKYNSRNPVLFSVFFQEIQPQIFEQILQFLYTRKCDLAREGTCPVHFIRATPTSGEEVNDKNRKNR